VVRSAETVMLSSKWREEEATASCDSSGAFAPLASSESVTVAAGAGELVTVVRPLKTSVHVE
jgi:hypothetical protein